MMFGMFADQKLKRVLDRHTDVDVVRSTLANLRREDYSVPIERTAIGIDANVLLKMATDSKSADVLDYFVTHHQAPLILPGQTVQEFWNNQLSSIATVSESIRNKHDQLLESIRYVEDVESPALVEIERALETFKQDNFHLYSQNVNTLAISMFEILHQRARLHFVPRLAFASICAQRKSTKTPPGFKDPGDGDFFVWADFLAGLIHEKLRRKFDLVVLVTDDKKKDWSREGVPHPVLSAEVFALFGCPFETWSYAKLSARLNTR